MRWFVFDATLAQGNFCSFKSEWLAGLVSELLTLWTRRFHDYSYSPA